MRTQLKAPLSIWLSIAATVLAVYMVMRDFPNVSWPSFVVSGIALILLAHTVLLGLPSYVVNWSTRHISPDEFKQEDRLKAENDVRTTLLQALGFLALVAGLFATWSQLQVSREGQITDRFTKAMDQVGNAKDTNVRMGGLYSLERIAKQSRDDRETITEIIASYVRKYAYWKGRPSEKDAVRGKKSKSSKLVCPPKTELSQLDSMSISETRIPDVQAALTILGRRLGREEEKRVIQIPLTEIDLRIATLASGHFEGIDFKGSNLELAWAPNAHFDGSTFGTDNGTYCPAHLEWINANPASFVGADLEGAKLNYGNLEGADFSRAILKNADLTGAILNKATFTDATANRQTKFPKGFKPEEHGIKMEN